MYNCRHRRVPIVLSWSGYDGKESAQTLSTYLRLAFAPEETILWHFSSTHALQHNPCALLWRLRLASLLITLCLILIGYKRGCNIVYRRAMLHEHAELYLMYTNCFCHREAKGGQTLQDLTGLHFHTILWKCPKNTVSRIRRRSSTLVWSIKIRWLHMRDELWAVPVLS